MYIKKKNVSNLQLVFNLQTDKWPAELEDDLL